MGYDRGIHDNRDCCVKNPKPPKKMDESCCCKEALKYALKNIYLANKYQRINIYSIFNDLQEENVTLEVHGHDQGCPKIGDVITVKKSDGTKVSISLCNTALITFADEPNVNSNLIYNCNKCKQCCCNGAIEKDFRKILGCDPDFPVDVDISARIVHSAAPRYIIQKIYGICNGIIWAKVKNESTGGYFYGALPECSLFKYYSNSCVPAP